jgi:hypothetical protein
MRSSIDGGTSYIGAEPVDLESVVWWATRVSDARHFERLCKLFAFSFATPSADVNREPVLGAERALAVRAAVLELGVGDILLRDSCTNIFESVWHSTHQASE